MTYDAGVNVDDPTNEANTLPAYCYGAGAGGFVIETLLASITRHFPDLDYEDVNEENFLEFRIEP